MTHWFFFILELLTVYTIHITFGLIPGNILREERPKIFAFLWKDKDPIQHFLCVLIMFCWLWKFSEVIRIHACMMEDEVGWEWFWFSWDRKQDTTKTCWGFSFTLNQAFSFTAQISSLNPCTRLLFWFESRTARILKMSSEKAKRFDENSPPSESESVRYTDNSNTEWSFNPDLQIRWTFLNQKWQLRKYTSTFMNDNIELPPQHPGLWNIPGTPRSQELLETTQEMGFIRLNKPCYQEMNGKEGTRGGVRSRGLRRRDNKYEGSLPGPLLSPGRHTRGSTSLHPPASAAGRTLGMALWCGIP